MTAVITTSTLSAKGDAWIRRSSMVLIAMVATAAGLLSWNGLTYLAIESGVPIAFSWLLALAVDGMILLATAEILHSSLTGRPVLFGWMLTLFGVSISIWGNIASVGDHSLQSQIVHGIAPVSLFLSVEAFARIVKFRITATQEMLEQQQKQAEKEAKRQARAEQLQSSPARTQASKSSGGGYTGKRGGSKLSASDPEVADYKEILEGVPADASKAGKVEAILRRYPSARSGHIAFALDIENQKSVATTIVRIRERVQADQGGSEQDDDGQFQQIVKDLVPASADSENK